VHRIVLLGTIVGVVLLAGAPSLLSKASDLRDRLPALIDAKRTAETQSAAQLSTAEFAGLARGVTPGMLRGRVGAPDHKGATQLEGIKIECWYYGVAEGKGAYQLCFVNGRLTSKLRYSERQS
jgi:hypothetical protein